MISRSRVSVRRSWLASFAPRCRVDPLRAMIGSRRKAPGIADLEPLIDVLAHDQDIARPLNRARPMPAPAAAAAATRAWSMGRPFYAERKLAGLHLAATDRPWQAGQGQLVECPIAALLLLITGRPAALSQLSGPGAATPQRKSLQKQFE